MIPSYDEIAPWELSKHLSQGPRFARCFCFKDEITIKLLLLDYPSL